MVHYLDKVSDLLILCRLYEPFPEVTLYCHVEHLLLLASEACSFYFLLDFDEFLRPQLHHLSKFLRTQEERGIAKLLWQGHLHELESWYD